MPYPLVIRPAAPSDRPQLRAAIVELQDAHTYLDWILHQAEAPGTVLVAEGQVSEFIEDDEIDMAEASSTATSTACSSW